MEKLQWFVTWKNKLNNYIKEEKETEREREVERLKDKVMKLMKKLIRCVMYWLLNDQKLNFKTHDK